MRQMFRSGLTLVLVAGATAFWAPPVPCQKNTQQETLLQRAIQKETVDGDLPAAIKLYKEILANPGPDRSVPARALLHLGQCNEKLGSAEARKAYEQLVREYGDQADIAAEGRARLAVLAGAAGVPGGTARGDRLVWGGPDVDVYGGISPDGRYCSFTDWATGDLAVRNLVTGQNRHVTNNRNSETSYESADFSTFSPNSKLVAYGWYTKDRYYDLRIIGIDGSRPRVIYANNERLDYIRPLSWSPDGRHVLARFTKEMLKEGTTNDQLALVSVADGSTRVLKGIDPRSPAFSPDGRYLAFGSPDARYAAYAPAGGIVLYELETGRTSTLIQDSAGYEVLGWAPDGRHILFVSDRSGTQDAWMFEVAGGKAVGEPAVVKREFNGGTIGFTRSGAFYYSLVNRVQDVYVAEIDPASGKAASSPQLVSPRWVGSTRTPDWSPDGRSLAYVRTRPNLSIVVRTMDTGQERVLRELKAGTGNIGHILRWTPDGKSIVVPWFEVGKEPGLWRVDAQTGAMTFLTPLPGTKGTFPRFDFSRDGRTIFHTDDLSVAARDLQTGKETTLLRRTTPVLGVAVSPDGRYLLVVTKPDTSQVLLVVPAAGGDPRELVRIDGDEANYRAAPLWTPDGRHVMFVKGQRGRATRNVQVWRVAVDGGEPQPVGLTVDELWWMRLHPDGRRVALAAWQSKFEIWVMENFLPATEKSR